MVKVKRQKVHSRRRKKIEPRNNSFNLKSIFKFILIIILLAAIGIGLERLKYLFADSDYFIIKTVDIRFYNEDGVLRNVSLGDITDGKIVGANIFLVDLVDLKDKIENAHPEFKNVLVKRTLPNKLIVQVKKRKPVMQIRSDRFYFVDEEGMLLPAVKSFPEQNLPVIAGIRTKIKLTGFTAPQKQDVDNALLLIRAMADNKRLSKYQIKMIDITDIRNISFFLDTDNVEIKIGDSEFTKRLDVLAIVFEQLGSDIAKVKYIDLRFDDPIVGPK